MSNLTVGCATIPDSTPSKVATKMIQEKGRISSEIYQIVGPSNKFVKALEGTKEFFPSELGDVMNEVILDISRPNERDVLDWQRQKAAAPGYNPCCTTMKEIPYGSRTVSACLYKDAWKTPEFCKADLAFKYKRDKQMRQQYEIMSQWTRDIWGHWSIVAYQRSVLCMSLNSQYGMPELLGEYPRHAPTTIATFQHLEDIFLRIEGEGGELGRIVPGFDLIFIGSSEFAALEEKYLADSAKLGMRAPAIELPELGQVRPIGKYMFVLLEKPRRFRDPLPNETWEDALVESTIQVETTRGSETRMNPDYYNDSTAPYSEMICYNASAVAWLVPPEAMTAPDRMYPASNYAGEFKLINPETDNDPFQETAYFAARYMAGMMPRFPRRARCVLTRAVHSRAKDVCVDSCGVAMPAEPEKWPVLTCCEVMGGDRLQLLLKKGTLPDACPDNSSLFIVTKGGNKYLIDSIISQEAYAGDSTHTEGGTLVTIALPSNLAEAATCRDECDAWDYVSCLPADTVSSDPTVDGCAGCSPNTVSTACTHTAVFDSVDGPVNIYAADGTTAFFGTDLVSPTAVAFEAAVQVWLDANGSGTAVVTELNGHWTLVITGSTSATLVGAQVRYDDGLHESNADVVRTGTCA